MSSRKSNDGNFHILMVKKKESLVRCVSDELKNTLLQYRLNNNKVKCIQLFYAKYKKVHDMHNWSCYMSLKIWSSKQ